MADHFAKVLASRHPDYVRRQIQMAVPEAELYEEKLRLHYTPEPLMGTLVTGPFVWT